MIKNTDSFTDSLTTYAHFNVQNHNLYLKVNY